MNKESIKKLGMLAAAAAMTSVLLSGCSGDKGNSGANGSAAGGAATNSGPLSIKMTLNFDGKEVPQAGNAVQQEIEKQTNTKLSLTHISSNDFCSKLPVMIASGDLPQIIASCGAPSQSYLLSSVQNGAFWDITPYIKDYKNLSQMPQISYDNIKIDGKIYGVPRYRPLSRYTFAYRKDWLDNLGLQQPKTLDEFYNILKAFTNNDPDKNGKNDTYGITVMIKNNAFSPDFSIGFGGPNNWGTENGKFVKAETTPAYLDALKFSKKLYDEKLMNLDFAAIDTPKFEGELENGKAGVISATSNNLLPYQSRIQSHNPNAKLDAVSVLAGPTGVKKVQSDRGSNGILMFPKSSVKTEADLKQLLGFLDKMNDKTMIDLLEWGIQGQHYVLKDGKAVRTNQDAYDNQVGFPYKYPLEVLPGNNIKTPGEVAPIIQRQLDIEKDNDQYALPDPTMTLLSATWTEKGSELQQMLLDAKVKFVMGKIDENGWKAAVEQFKKAGGDKAAQEYADAYTKAAKK
jgi:putative aldouronate transport system substrate-binding protein